MFIDAVAGIDDRNPQRARHGVDRAGITVPQHHTIAVVVEHMGHVLQGFPLGDPRGGPIGDVDRTAPQPMPGTVERQARSRAGFVEGVDQDLAPQRDAVGDVSPGVAFVFRGQPKQLKQGFGSKGLDRHHMLIDKIQQRFGVLIDRGEQRLGLGAAIHIRADRCKPHRLVIQLGSMCCGNQIKSPGAHG